MLQGDRARGVRGFGPRRGVGIRAGARGVDSGPGREVGWGFGPRARGGDSGPGRGVGIFLVRWEIFYLFAVFSPFG